MTLQRIKVLKRTSDKDTPSVLRGALGVLFL